MTFAHSRAICVTVSLTLSPSLLHAAPPVASPSAPASDVAPATISPGETTSAPPAATSPTSSTTATPTTATTPPPSTPTTATTPPSPTPTTATTPASPPTSAPKTSPASEPSEPSSEPTPRQRPRTWQIYQRPLPGAEHSWGPPNGQMPAVVEVSETPVDPDQPPPNGMPRIIIGAIVGTLGLGVFGLGIAARTTDVFGEDRRAGVPLLGAGLVTAAIGWGLFAHGILRRKAFQRWEAGRATVAPTLGGATLLLRF